MQFAAYGSAIGRYHAHITVEELATGIKRAKRFPLEGVTPDALAVAKLQELLTQQRKGTLPGLKGTPKFADYADQHFNYYEHYEQVKDAKRESTLYTEKTVINHWKEHLDHVRLDRITRALVNSYIAKRQASGRSGRPVNLEVTCFRNGLNRALDDHWIAVLPTQNLRPLKWTPQKRSLLTWDEINKLCTVAESGDKFKNGLVSIGRRTV